MSEYIVVTDIHCSCGQVHSFAVKKRAYLGVKGKTETKERNHNPNCTCKGEWLGDKYMATLCPDCFADISENTNLTRKPDQS